MPEQLLKLWIKLRIPLKRAGMRRNRPEKKLRIQPEMPVKISKRWENLPDRWERIHLILLDHWKNYGKALKKPTRA